MPDPFHLLVLVITCLASFILGALIIGGILTAAYTLRPFDSQWVIAFGTGLAAVGTVATLALLVIQHRGLQIKQQNLETLTSFKERASHLERRINQYHSSMFTINYLVNGLLHEYSKNKHYFDGQTNLSQIKQSAIKNMNNLYESGQLSTKEIGETVNSVMWSQIDNLSDAVLEKCINSISAVHDLNGNKTELPTGSDIKEFNIMFSTYAPLELKRDALVATLLSQANNLPSRASLNGFCSKFNNIQAIHGINDKNRQRHKEDLFNVMQLYIAYLIRVTSEIYGFRDCLLVCGKHASTDLRQHREMIVNSFLSVDFKYAQIFIPNIVDFQKVQKFDFSVGLTKAAYVNYIGDKYFVVAE